MEKLSMYYFDLDDDYVCLIKDRNGNRFTAGRNKANAQDLIEKLNKAHRPNVEQISKSVIKICWNNHERSEACEWEVFDLSEKFEKHLKNTIMKQFNINDYIYIHITEEGWRYLQDTAGDFYIRLCVESREVIINEKKWYRLQCHEVFSMLPMNVGQSVKFMPTILIDDEFLTDIE